MDTDRNGDATIGIQLGTIFLNNNTIKISMNDKLFDTIAEMQIGDKVVVSGYFTDGWYLNTGLADDRAMQIPIFSVSFTDIRKR